nr:MAG: hypothetical protein 1 [Leviviridae sp.]
MSVTTRKRSNRVHLGDVSWWEDAIEGPLAPERLEPPQWADGYVQAYAPDSLAETQITVSENHPSWNSRNGFSGDIGGNFYTSKKSMHIAKTPAMMWINRHVGFPFPTHWERTYRYGPMLAANPSQIASSGGYPSAPASSDDDLDEFGATAISRCAPTNSVADVSTFLGEIVKEGIPNLIGSTLWKERTREARRHKDASDEFLNFQFGWKPMVSEIDSIAHAITHADLVLKQFQRDSGKMVRRRYSLPSEETTQVTQFGTLTQRGYLPGYSNGLHQLGSPLGRVTKVRTSSTRRWFSGAFTYHLPSSGNTYDSMRRSALEAKKLFGISLTPDVVWNLAPWSWAVDWFTNAGDVIENLSTWAMYGQCLRYGYVMEHRIVSDAYHYNGPSGWKTPNHPVSLVLKTETKSRRRANPFGFGLTWNGLNPIQLAIAAALGISRW